MTGMRLPFTRRHEPEGPSEVDTLRDELAAAQERITAADRALVPLLAALRADHRPTPGLNLRHYIDLALDVRIALRTPEHTGQAVTE